MDAGVEPGDEEQVVLEELYDENYEPTDAGRWHSGRTCLHLC